MHKANVKPAEEILTGQKLLFDPETPRSTLYKPNKPIKPMSIKFSRHALRQMKWRQITEQEVLLIINNPDRLENSVHQRKNAYKTLEDRKLKVTYKQEDDDIIIITALVVEGHGIFPL